MLREPSKTDGNPTLNLRHLTHVESLVVTDRHANAFTALAMMAEALHSQDPTKQAAALMSFTIENAELVEDVIAFGSDQHANKAAIRTLPVETKLLALGQILALTGMQMQAEEIQAADLQPPSSIH